MARIHYRGFSLGEWVMSRCSAASYTCRATRTESHMIPPPPPSSYTRPHIYTFLEALRWSWWFQKDRRRRTPSGSPTITSPLPAAASNRPRVLPSFRPSQKSLQYFSKRKHLGVGGVLTGEEKVVLCWWGGRKQQFGAANAPVSAEWPGAVRGAGIWRWRCPRCWNAGKQSHRVPTRYTLYLVKAEHIAPVNIPPLPQTTCWLARFSISPASLQMKPTLLNCCDKW